MWIVGLVVGGVIGGAYNAAMGVLGALIGVGAGIAFGSKMRALRERLVALEARLSAVEQLPPVVRVVTAGAPVAAQADALAAAALAPDVASAPVDTAIAPAVGCRGCRRDPAGRAMRVADRAGRSLPLGAQRWKGHRGARRRRRRTSRRRPPGQRCPRAPVDAAAAPVRQVAPPPRPAWMAWIMGGNTLARVGVLLLFIGVGFLVKYASEHVHVPIEMRLAGVALGGIALLVLGWRLRLARPGYAMILQGGGVGVLYLTVFGALRLYGLISPPMAFALLVAIAGLSAWLAIRQDAIAMAVIGIVGGFLAPILASSNSGNHVMLFSYYALLNAGIFAIAWFKAWRVLNVVGFLFTFVIATIWGVTRYRPENFASTEPFLILFFLFYVGIAVLYALRQSLTVRNYLDSTLVFGTPLFVAGLQAGMVRDMRYGMALSALAMSAVYLVLARVLYTRKSEGLRLLVEAFLALGTIFATLAIPLAVDSRWTSATWALEGAAMLWVGIRQQRLAVRAFGLLLQLGAGIAFASGFALWNHAPAPERLWPLVNSDFVGAVIVGLAGLFSARLMHRAASLQPSSLRAGEELLGPLLLAWGTLWWLAAGWREIERWLPYSMRIPALVALLALTAVAFAMEDRRASWPAARVPPMLLLPILLLIALAGIAGTGYRAWGWRVDVHLFAGGGYLAWPLAIAVCVWLLRLRDRDGPPGLAMPEIPPDFRHAMLLWLVTLLCAHELAWLGTRVGSGAGVWTLVPWGLVPALAIALVTVLATRPSWPVGAHARGYTVVGGAAVAVALALWSLFADFADDADPFPLPYVPLFNPLDIAQAVVLCSLLLWWLRARQMIGATTGQGSAQAALG